MKNTITTYTNKTKPSVKTLESDIPKNQVLFKKGQYIIKEGSSDFGLYYINQGRVKVIEKSTGIKQTFRIADKDNFIEYLDFKNSIYPVCVIALEDSIVSFIDKNIINNAFTDNPEFISLLIKYYTSEICKSETMINHLTQLNASKIKN